MPSLQEDREFPREILVGHRKFVIIFRKSGEIELDGEPAAGLASWDEGTIEIEETIDNHLAAEVLLHETMHMYWELLGMKSRASEESAILFTGRAISMLLLQNKELVDWIRKALA